MKHLFPPSEPPACRNHAALSLSLHLSLFAFILLLFIPSHLRAQAVFGNIVGTVTDPTGAVIPNATVTVTDTSKGISQVVKSNASGNFEVTRLIPDTYVVKADAQGFSSAQSGSIAITADQTQQVNLQLQAAG